MEQRVFCRLVVEVKKSRGGTIRLRCAVSGIVPLFIFALSTQACTDSVQVLGLGAGDATALGGKSANGPSPGSSSLGGGTNGDPAGSGGENTGAGGGASTLEPGPTGTKLQVSAGDVHTCAIVDSLLYCWGANGAGALGLGDVEGRAVPARVGSAQDWTAVGTGDQFSCGIRGGKVSCWGHGADGQLGAGQFSSVLAPAQISLSGPALQIAVGQSTACAITEGNTLWCWGANAEGQLAQGDPFSGPGVNSAVPVQVDVGETFQSVSIGQGHACAIRMDNTLWCWGRNPSGEIGQAEGYAAQVRVPIQVLAPAEWKQIACGQQHTCGIAQDDSLYCWGNNTHNQLGLSAPSPVYEPTAVPGQTNIAQVALDTFHSCALTIAGELSCTGRNIEGMLGDGTFEPKAAFTSSTPQSLWDFVSVGRFHTCGVRAGAILCAGENADGRLGVGDTTRRDIFTPTAQ